MCMSTENKSDSNIATSDLGQMVKEWGLVGIVGLVGIGILLYGVWRVVAPEKARVEIVENRTENKNIEYSEEIIVDVAGAVEKPGLYKLPSGSRVGDALVNAGGLSAEADRNWVSRYINLAEEVKDGSKVYIPLISESANQQISELDGQTAGVSDSRSGGKININTASVSELDSLWGVGEARANTIINNRPYGSVEEFLDRASIPQNVFDKIKDQISVY